VVVALVVVAMVVVDSVVVALVVVCALVVGALPEPVTGVPEAVMVELDCTTDTAPGMRVGPGTMYVESEL
jgi:hypothetical protein